MCYAGVQSCRMTDHHKKAVVLTELSLMLAAVFWGTNYAATKYAAAFMPPLLIVGVRFTVGGLLMLALLRVLEPASRLAPKDLLPVAGLGCLGVAIGQTAFTFGVSMTSAANTGLIFATAPVWGLLLGSILGLERPTPRGILGVGLSILGVGIVFYEGLGAEGASLGGGGLLGAARRSRWQPTLCSSADWPSCCSLPCTLLVWSGVAWAWEPGRR